MSYLGLSEINQQKKRKYRKVKYFENENSDTSTGSFLQSISLEFKVYEFITKYTII